MRVTGTDIVGVIIGCLLVGMVIGICTATIIEWGPW